MWRITTIAKAAVVLSGVVVALSVATSIVLRGGSLPAVGALGLVLAALLAVAGVSRD